MTLRSRWTKSAAPLAGQNSLYNARLPSTRGAVKIAGAWLSGRAFPSHGRGRRFNPYSAHQYHQRLSRSRFRTRPCFAHETLVIRRAAQAETVIGKEIPCAPAKSTHPSAYSPPPERRRHQRPLLQTEHAHKRSEWALFRAAQQGYKIEPRSNV
jgi:hypothetical protein